MNTDEQLREQYNPEGSPLRRHQMQILEIMKFVDGICREQDIPLWLDFGTLLGAVRHKGFIPWDDDADVSIFLRDEKRLMASLKASLPQGWSVTRREGHFRHHGYFKVDDGKGAFLDIFNIEHGNRRIKEMLNRTHGKVMRRISRQVEDGNAKLFAACLARPFTALFARLCALCARRGSYTYNLDNYVVWQMLCGRREEDILPLCELEFEGCRFRGPANPGSFLVETYGTGYMNVPPEEKRETHNLPLEQ